MNSENDVHQNNLTLLKTLIQDNTVLLNRANFCGHCHHFQPEFDRYVQMAKAQKTNVVQIENDALARIRLMQPALYSKVVSDQGLYFPMVIIYIKKKTHEIYEGPRTAEALRQTVAEKLAASASVVKSIKTPSVKSVKTPSADKKPKRKASASPDKKPKRKASASPVKLTSKRAAHIIEEAKKNKK